MTKSVEQTVSSQSEGNEELKVFISSRESTCGECGENLGSHACISLARDKGALCLACADLDHLIFLPSGNTALTRRARKHSTLNAVVLKWSRARKRYERQDLLVEPQALEKAEEECLADSEIRARRREREVLRRDEVDREYVEKFAARVRELFPGCPAGERRRSGRARLPQIPAARSLWHSYRKLPAPELLSSVSPIVPATARRPHLWAVRAWHPPWFQLL